MDKKILTQIANSNPTAKAMFEHFRTRDRNPKDGVMDIRRTKYALKEMGVSVVPKEFIANFRAMEKAGLGKLEMEDGKPTRFRWSANMKRAGELATEASTQEPEPKKLVSTPIIPHNTVELVVVLAPGREATISLPAHLTREEAEVLCSALVKKAR